MIGPPEGGCQRPARIALHSRMDLDVAVHGTVRHPGKGVLRYPVNEETPVEADQACHPCAWRTDATPFISPGISGGSRVRAVRGVLPDPWSACERG